LFAQADAQDRIVIEGGWDGRSALSTEIVVGIQEKLQEDGYIVRSISTLKYL
jgi:hypothetical protein